ncbi:Long-chain-alcohol oxidase fao4a [Thalictrum thalictroides]|uniref:Long-chain-alcohol oxidase fao4a n=1 Tax=Thalictrum thalictroides TaxID=46969 RepID=A0A7J6WQH3_THATH|nr:Long-chain-alcohol oxidase fao4a [Thalictrum thalictroides]
MVDVSISIPQISMDVEHEDGEAMRADIESKLSGGPHEDQCKEKHAKAVGNQPYLINSLSRREMDSLTAFCDTLLPCIHTPTSTNHSDDLLTFYTTSASMAGLPQHLGGFLSQRVKHPSLFLVRLVLWMLSTWVGTMLFYSVKSLALFLFFTQVNENNENSSWKAIDYYGPDPDVVTPITPKSASMVPPLGPGRQNLIPQVEEENRMNIGPLYRGLVDPTVPKKVLADTLKRSGFSVSYDRQTSKLTIHCDAVVVGSGSGGGVAAGILAKAGYKVIVLEKGSYFARKRLSLLEGPTMDQMYQGSGFVATKDLGVAILAGSTIGGGSTINWSASIKTPHHVINEWCNTYQLELFQSQLYKEAVEAVCDKMGVQSENNDENLSNAVLRKGCLELGYPVNDIPRNSPPDHYCGWCCLGCKDGKKKGTAETWLVDMVDSGNGLIFPGCEVIKILRERRKGMNCSTATGVAFKFDNGKEKEVYLMQSKVTIVAGGAIGTPTLLKKSGLKNKNIGKHLHLHPVVMSWGYFPNSPSSSGWPEQCKKSYEGGIMTAMSTVVGEFNKSGYGAIIQTPALHPGLFSCVMPWMSGADMKDRMSKFSRTAHIFALARDKGSGEVNSFSSLSYRMDDSDEENLKRGIEKTLRILAAAGAEEIGTHHFKGKKLNVKTASSYELERFVKEESRRGIKGLSMPIYSAHQMGSCRMGVDPKTSVVNPNGETWEVEGLFVADSSVFPTALGVNPMVTIQAIAYCTAQSVVEAKDMKLDGNLCHLPKSPAFILGILACLCVLVAQIIGNIVLVMHFRSAKSEVMAWKQRTIILMVVLSWISFGFAIILLGVSTSMNRMQPYGKGWLDGECYVVKEGVYNAAAGLIVLTVTFMLISILGTRWKFCGKQIEQDRIHNTVMVK